MLKKSLLSNTKKYLIVGLLFIFGSTVLFTALAPSKANALSGSAFNPGRIIDDAIFYNGNSMTESQIQNFLNSKVPACDTNGSKSYSYYYNSNTGEVNNHNEAWDGDTWVTTSRATYGQRVYNYLGASYGSRAPFVCLKDYRQNTTNIAPESGLCNGYSGASNESAARIIYKTAQSCGVSPKVLLVMLDKEQSLVTDEWPWGRQYDKAMGAFCPDTAPCNPTYKGFFYQVYYGAHRFKVYKANPNGYNYKAQRNNAILWHPNHSCGTSNVFIENQATAGLYIYTPYRPNQAALDNYPGTGNSCSSYGNRNFWFKFNEWFGPTTNNAYSWELIHDTSSGRLYLVVGTKRHWIPSPALLVAWGLDDNPYRDVSSSYVNQLTPGANLSHVALDINGTRYFMSQGKKFRLKSDDYVLAWGVAGISHISAPGLIIQTPSGGDAGRFAKVGSTTYLLNNYEKHLPLNANSFSHWGITSSNTTSILASDISHIPDGAPVGQFTQFGPSKKIIDNGKRLTPKNNNILEGWEDQNYISTFPFAYNILPKQTLGSFVTPSSENKIYFVENSTHHYVPTPSHTVLWGMGSNNPLTAISDDLFSHLTTGANLSHVARNSVNGNTYLIAGKRYQFSTTNLASLYSGSTSHAIPSYSNESLLTLPTGSSIISPIVRFPSDSKIYVVDNGKLRHVASPEALYGLGGSRNNPTLQLTSSLKGMFGVAGSVSHFAKDNSSTYYLENGYRYRIDDYYIRTWGANSASVVSAELMQEVSNSGQTLKSNIKIGNRYYLVNNSVLIDVSSNYQTFGLSSSDFGFIFSRPMPSTGVDGYFVRSMTNSKIYILSYGKIYYVNSPQVLSDLGFGKHSGIINLHPNLMESLLAEQPTVASRLIKTPSSGVLFASQGKGYTMPSLSTLNEYMGDGRYMEIAPEFFNKFSYKGAASKLVNGTDGKVYAIVNGQKRWVTSPSALQNNYPGEKILSLPQITIDGFGTGGNIN